MNRNLTTLLAILPVLNIGAFAQQASKESPAPDITFSSTTFDFGRIKQGETPKHSFIFTNTGNATLEVLDVKPGCGCTTPGSWDKKVEPGQTGSIPLQFNSAGFGGKVSKSATVTCNVPGKTNIILHFSGEVWKPIDVTPQIASFTFPSENQTNQTRVIRITNNLDEEITLSPPECVNPVFKPELKTIKPGKEWELSVTALAPLSGPTQLGTVLVRTSSAQVPALNVTAYANIPPVIAVMPSQIMLPTGPLKTPFSTKVSLRSNSTNSVTLSDLAVDIPGAEAKLEGPKEGKTFTIALSFPTELQIVPGQNFALTVKTDHPRAPLVRVPIFQQQPSHPATALKPAAAPATPPPAAPAATPSPKTSQAASAGGAAAH